MSQFFVLGGQSIGDSALVLPMNIQGWEDSPNHTERKWGGCGFSKWREVSITQKEEDWEAKSNRLSFEEEFLLWLDHI